MQWIKNYQLFLLDFDGLLVNTEEIHYQAYKMMCHNRGVDFNWSFDKYCLTAHYHADAFRGQLFEEFPELPKQEPNWSILYEEKKQALLKIVDEGNVHLMPGADAFLQFLKDFNRVHCVVTNSPQELIQKIKNQISAINTIPHWVTREAYSHPKPHPECYLKAVERFAKPGEKVIGFEDTPRGMRALLAAGVKAVMISQSKYPEIPAFLEQGALYFPSLEALKDNILN